MRGVPRNSADAYKMVRAVCRSCHEVQSAYLSDFNKATRARCYRCGSQLDRVGKPLKSRGRKPSRGPGADDLDYPARCSEFEVQAYIYWTLKAKGYDVRGEVSSRLRAFVLDLVVYVDRRPVLIIETKSRLGKKTGGWGSEGQRLAADDAEGRRDQLAAYRTLGLPVVSVSGMEQAIAYCNAFVLPPG
jgi:hypothetical protein